MIISAIISLGSIGTIGAIILYLVSVKFHVDEDPLIASVLEILPGANCGGCGFPGCEGFAVACVASLDHLFCPAGGDETMKLVAAVLGKTTHTREPKIAVIKCNGACDVRPRTCRYDGAKKCALIASLYGGETDCTYGCIGFGDCVEACTFDAIRINPATRLAEITEDKCTSCGACVKACPKKLIELRKKGPKSRRIYVSCVNKATGAVALKACANVCTGCGNCLNVCGFDAISVANNVAYIDCTKCRLCRKCAPVCPTGAILEINFPPKKSKVQPDNA
jgi:Na+-translocating ferredoxin:NAD+ oxidoreductase RNF subunit RnfB